MEDSSKIEVVNLSKLILPISLIQKTPSELMKRHQFIPISLKDNTLTCAFAGIPLSDMIDDIESATAYKIKIALATKDEILSRLKELFPASVTDHSKVKEPMVSHVKRGEASIVLALIILAISLMAFIGWFWVERNPVINYLSVWELAAGIMGYNILNIISFLLGINALRKNNRDGKVVILASIIMMALMSIQKIFIG